MYRLSRDEQPRQCRLTRELADYELPDDNDDNDALTFLLSPTKLLVDYENTQYDTKPRPGIPGLWSDSTSWIGQ